MSTNFGNTNVTKPITTSVDTPGQQQRIRQQSTHRPSYAHLGALELSQTAEHFRQFAGSLSGRNAGNVGITKYGRLRMHRIRNAFSARHIFVDLGQSILRSVGLVHCCDNELNAEARSTPDRVMMASCVVTLSKSRFDKLPFRRFQTVL